MAREKILEKAKSSVPSFAEKLSFFIACLRNSGKAEGTIANYSHHLAKLCLHHGRLPEGISDAEYVAYYSALLGGNASGSQMKHAVYSVRSYFHHMQLQCPLHANPPIPHEQKLPDIPSVPEVRAILAKATDLRDKCVIGVLYGCGLRVGELLRLRLGDVDMDRSTIHVRGGKGRKDRFVFMGRNLRVVLAAYMRTHAPSEYLFERAPGVPLRPHVPRRTIAQKAAEAGVSKRLSPHSLRHAFATHLLEAGVNIRKIQQWLGHKSIITTCRYLRMAAVPDGSSAVSPLDVIYPVAR